MYGQQQWSSPTIETHSQETMGGLLGCAIVSELARVWNELVQYADSRQKDTHYLLAMIVQFDTSGKHRRDTDAHHFGGYMCILSYHVSTYYQQPKSS